jgi:hypothetical protein
MKLAPAMQFALVFDWLWLGLLSQFEVSGTGLFILVFMPILPHFFCSRIGHLEM